MTCDSAGEQMDLYFYGELSSQQEEELEQHLHECGVCSAGLERRKTLHRGLDELRMTPPPHLLVECREALFSARPVQRKPPFWRQFSGMLRPAGALALVALGFFSARFTVREPAPANLVSAAGDPIFSTIRSVQPDSLGHVQIAVDETRRRLVTGSLNDANIERLMLAAAKDESNDGLRVESVELLKGHAASAGVRDALLTALRNDPNPGVRFKVLDALKGMAAEPEVRKTLSYVLQNDMNPGVRIQAIDLLTQHQDAGMVGMLQQLVAKESNSYVRQRCEKALEEMNASVGTF